MATVVLYHCAKFQPNRTMNKISGDICIFGLSRLADLRLKSLPYLNGCISETKVAGIVKLSSAMDNCFPSNICSHGATITYTFLPRARQIRHNF